MSELLNDWRKAKLLSISTIRREYRWIDRMIHNATLREDDRQLLYGARQALGWALSDNCQKASRCVVDMASTPGISDKYRNKPEACPEPGCDCGGTLAPERHDEQILATQLITCLVLGGTDARLTQARPPLVEIETAVGPILVEVKGAARRAPEESE